MDVKLGWKIETRLLSFQVLSFLRLLAEEKMCFVFFFPFVFFRPSKMKQFFVVVII